MGRKNYEARSRKGKRARLNDKFGIVERSNVMDHLPMRLLENSAKETNNG